MKKRQGTFVLFFLLLSIVFLSACQRLEDPVAVSEALVEAIIFKQESEFLEENLSLTNQKEGDYLQQDLKREIKSLLNLADSYDEELATLYQSHLTQLEKTTFKAKLIKEEKGKAEIQLTIKGLKPYSAAEVSQTIEEQLTKNQEEIKATLSQDEQGELVKKITLAVVKDLVAQQDLATESQSIKVTLFQDPSEKSKWLIQNDQQLLDELLAAYGY